MRQPLISVLIPVYNVEKYLDRCMESVLSQTLPNIEVICVNDGSTDGSLKVLEKYAKQDSRVRIVSKENGGLPSARNAGLDIARGRYVGFVDSDDYIEPHMFETLYRTAEDTKSEVVICGANIFPEEPHASNWLYSTLSPEYRHYDSFTPDLLYDRIDTNPFLWRCLIKKSLIDQHDFRLDEDIIIGEDKAFQCKVYPEANGITTIPDKLYNYFWCRPDSLMNMVHEKIGLKIKEHVNLVARIAEDFEKKELPEKLKEKTNRDFLEWSIPFINTDFIYATYAQKREMSSRLIKTWDKCGYHMYENEMPKWKTDMYDYVSSFQNVEAENIKWSVLLPVEYKSEYLKEWIDRAGALRTYPIEIIVINNGASQENYGRILEAMKKNQKIRLFNTPEHYTYAAMLNAGIELAKGSYLAICETHDWFKDAKSLLNWFEFAKKNNYDICPCLQARKNGFSDGSYETIWGQQAGTKVYDYDYHALLYKKSFLVEKDVFFDNCSVLTGKQFLWRLLLEKPAYGEYRQNVYIIRQMYHENWLPTDKCENVLATLDDLMDLSIEKEDPAMHVRILSILNSDLIKHIIAENTRPYAMPSWQCPNGENSQIKTVSSLFKIISKVKPEYLEEEGYTSDDSILETVCAVLHNRQEFLKAL